MSTTSYFFERVLPRLPEEARVLDIGCGQGEFVERLLEHGVEAIGYDPVVRKAASYLVAEYWSPESASADVFVMRCLLPHIPEPWGFLESIGRAHPEALVLVEFQRLEWILAEAVWYQVAHDHVNLFSFADFQEGSRSSTPALSQRGSGHGCSSSPRPTGHPLNAPATSPPS